MFPVNKNDQPKLTTLLEYLQTHWNTPPACSAGSLSYSSSTRDWFCLICICSTDQRDLIFRYNKCVKAYFHYFGYVFISLNKASPQNLSHFWQSISVFLLCCTIKPGQALPQPQPQPLVFILIHIPTLYKIITSSQLKLHHHFLEPLGWERKLSLGEVSQRRGFLQGKNIIYLF